MQSVIVENLVKTYPEHRAVDGISFNVKRGETFALLGPNGAGKTTTIEVLEGYRKADEGSVQVLGLDPARRSRQLKSRIGIVLQTTALEPELTVLETIEAFARLYVNVRDIEATLDDVNLSDQRNSRVGTLSGGQKRRLEIALGIIGNPELIFLDEPTTGLDPEARRKIWALIRKLQAGGCSILLSSHYMDEVQTLADRMVILVNGRISAEGAPSQLQKQHCKSSTIAFDAPGGLPAGLPDKLAQQFAVENGRAQLCVTNPGPALAELTSAAAKEKFDLSSLTVSRRSLEDIYLELAGNHTEGAEQP